MFFQVVVVFCPQKKSYNWKEDSEEPERIQRKMITVKTAYTLGKRNVETSDENIIDKIMVKNLY
jgi:hypothetical protein